MLSGDPGCTIALQLGKLARAHSLSRYALMTQLSM